MSLEVIKRICAEDPSDRSILIVAPDVSVLEGSWMNDARLLSMGNFEFNLLNSKNVSNADCTFDCNYSIAASLLFRFTASVRSMIFSAS